MKACFVASSGGHWEELMCINEIALEYEAIYITEEGGQAFECGFENLYIMPQINRRERLFIWKFVKLFIRAWRIVYREKPKFIITTGALIAYPFCLIGKLYGSKIIYIESFARVYDRSLTGKLIYPIADLFLVQWKPLLQLYPKAKYVGGIF